MLLNADERIVTAQSGLRLRKTPDLNGEKITVIPFNEKVNVITQKKQSITIDGLTGHWAKIQWKDKTGWVFDGYLASPPADENPSGRKYSGDFNRLFQDAYSLIHSNPPDFSKALEMLEYCINNDSNKAGSDYYYAWAAYCLAELKRYDECLEYYRIIRTKFYGLQTEGRDGAERNWEDRMNEIRIIVSTDEKARPVLEKMNGIDDEAKKGLLHESGKKAQDAESDESPDNRMPFDPNKYSRKDREKAMEISEKIHAEYDSIIETALYSDNTKPKAYSKFDFNRFLSEAYREKIFRDDKIIASVIDKNSYDPCLDIYTYYTVYANGILCSYDGHIYLYKTFPETDRGLAPGQDTNEVIKKIGNPYVFEKMNETYTYMVYPVYDLVANDMEGIQDAYYPGIVLIFKNNRLELIYIYDKMIC